MKDLLKLSIALSVIMITGAFRQSVQTNTYAAYLSGSMQLWERSIQGAEEKYKSSQSNEDRFQLAMALYGGLSATMRDKDEDFFDQYVDDAMDHLDDMEEEGYREADCKAIKSGIYGFKIAYSPWKGMFLGPKSSSAIESALEKDPNSPIVQKLYGNSKLFTPETWGGDKEVAVKAYEKAVLLYKNTPNSESDWMFLDTYAWLGQAYEAIDKKEKAREAYLASLEIEKDFNWVNYVLLPQVSQ